jgi:hypothetical protein
MQNKHVGYYIGGGLLVLALAFGAEEALAVRPDYKTLQDAGIPIERFERYKSQGKYPLADKKHWEGELEPGESFDKYVDGLLKSSEESSGRTLSRPRFKNAVEKFARKKGITLPKVAAPCWEQLQWNYIEDLVEDLERLEDLYKSMENEIAGLREKDAEQDSRIKKLEERPVPEQKDYSREIEQLEEEYDKMDKLEGEIQNLENELESLKKVRIQLPAEEAYAGPVQVQPGYVFVDVLPAYPYTIGPIFEYYVCGRSIFHWDRFHHGLRYFGRFGNYDWDFYGKYWRMKEDHRIGHRRDHHRHWEHGKERDIRRDYQRGNPRNQCEPRHRGREWPDDRGRGFEDRNRHQLPRDNFRRGQQFNRGQTWHPPASRNFQNFQGFQGRGQQPFREDYRSHQLPRGNSPRGSHPNQQFRFNAPGSHVQGRGHR